MWTELFFIKFEGKIENVRGNAKNIFNFTQNEKVRISEKSVQISKNIFLALL